MGYTEVKQKSDENEGRSKFEKTKTASSRMRSFGLYLLNPSKKTVLERTGLSWAKIGLFYLIFYGCLAGFWAGMLFGFFTTIEDDHPKMQDWDSLIKYNPGMGYRPQPNVEYTLIAFNQGEQDSYEKYTQSLNKFLEDYQDDEQDGLVECNPKDPAQDNWDPNLACKYPISSLGPECTSEKHFGFDEGRPCVLLKMNKLFNWVPESYSNDTVPKNVKNYNGDYISVTCEGVTPTDVDNVGPVKFWPEDGFNSMYFPYRNQKNYKAPLVMAQFQRLRPGTLVQVWCKVWAKNIYHDRNDRAGSVGFEMLMD